MISVIVELCPRGGGQVLCLCFHSTCAASSLICHFIHSSRKRPLVAVTKKRPWLIDWGQKGKIFRNWLYKHLKLTVCLQSSLVFPRRNAEIDVFNLLSEHLPLGSFSREATRSDERLFLFTEESAFLFDDPCQPSRWEERKKTLKGLRKSRYRICNLCIWQNLFVGLQEVKRRCPQDVSGQSRAESAQPKPLHRIAYIPC